MASLALAFNVLAKDGASKVLNDIGDSADKTGRKLGGLGGTAKAALGGAAVAGIAAFGAAMVQGVKDAVSFETLAKKSAAVIKSTGNAANISVEGIQSLAGSLESLSGVDEELIINSQNVLATFTKIKNSGNDKIFDKATESALDMSVALGQDLQGATTLVGKALNDPIAGLTALGRAGVQFTEAQKEQIRAMVESGDVMGAQKTILGELETQFGGAAEAAGSGLAGSMARLQDAMGDAFREIATALLPTLTTLAEWMAQHLPGAIEDFKRGLGIVSDFATTYVWPVLQFGADVLKGIASVIADPVIPMIGTLIEWFGKIATGIASTAEGVADRVRAIVGFFTDLASGVASIASTLWKPLETTFKSVINGIIRAWNALDFEVGPYKIPDWVPGGLGGAKFHIKDVFPDIETLHTGGTVTPWGIEPLRPDEIMARLQVGETVLPADGVRGAYNPGDSRTINLTVNNAHDLNEDALAHAIAWRIA